MAYLPSSSSIISVVCGSTLPVGEGEGLIALLHFSAVISVLCVAFIGFDRSRIEKSNLADGIKAAKSKAEQVMLRLGLPTALSPFGHGKWDVRPIFLANIICIIADSPLELPYTLYLVHFFYRQKHIPFFRFFKKNYHVITNGIMTWTSCAIFTVLCASIVFGHPSVFLNPNKLPEYIVFVLLLLIGVWIIFTGWCGRQLQTEALTAKCESLELNISKHFKNKRDKAIKALKRASDLLSSLEGPDAKL